MRSGGPDRAANARLKPTGEAAGAAPAATTPEPGPSPILETSTANPPTPPVLIGGGGIAGLSTAIALAGRGIPSTILERRPAFSEAGAGIQIGPNGVKALRALGAADLLEPAVGRPAGIVIRDGRTARPTTTLPLGDWIEARHGAPYWTAHRADLHAALLACARGHAPISITMGFDARNVAETEDGIAVRSSTGEITEGCALVAADGLWSTLRQHVATGSDPRVTGRRAFRAVIPAEMAPATLDVRNWTGMWMAPGTHVVHYPVRGRSEIAIVVVTHERLAAEGYEAAAIRDDVTGRVASLAPALVELVSAAEAWGAWSLYELARPVERWHHGRIGLLGDAAHPMLPFLAQGAVMALEDALELSRRWPSAPQTSILSRSSIEDAFAGYEAARRRRVQRVADTARRNGNVYHLSGPAALARDMALRMASGPRLMAQYDWLYGWNAKFW